MSPQLLPFNLKIDCTLRVSYRFHAVYADLAVIHSKVQLPRVMSSRKRPCRADVELNELLIILR